MATVSLAPTLQQKYTNANGLPLAAGYVYTYQAGTTTPQTTYVDSGGVTANANPVVLDANGEAAIWLDVSLSYKFVIKDSSGVTQKTLDNVIGLLTNNSVATESLQDGSVTTAKLAANAVDSTKLGGDASVDGNRAVATNNIKDSAVTTAKIASGAVSTVKLDSSTQGSLVPTGAVIAFGGSAAPTGYLLCDGTAVSRTTYATLYAVLGNAHGSGDNTTTFNLPDYRGRFLRGVDGAAGNDPDKLTRTAMNTGGNTGNAVGTVQTDQYASHNHNIYGNSTGGTLWNLTLPGAYAVAAMNAGSGGAYDNILDASGVAAIQASGGNESRPKNANVNFIIKT